MNGAGARRKGKTCEHAVRVWWDEHVARLIAPMQEDGADDLIDVEHGLSIECKNQKAMALAAWVDQSVAQGERRGLIPVVVHKRAGRTDPGRWYVTLELRAFAALLARLGGGR